ncbi:SDR family oxidoreductase [Aspergillus stella-maris]|uniref:SDR family oxidoreductase n=1 Tax=Aspergillus stella-maris TaxID=1810926 RepID=UPI003CCDF0BD
MSTPTSTYTIKSHGPIHGLSTYPSTTELSNLTAIVTGANGLSGYNMVRVLAAAPERWEKIYCLSRGEPSESFFEDLGLGAGDGEGLKGVRERVEHVAVDFMDGGEEIARALKERIPRVDHVFFFSYSQPAQEGNVLGMWSDAKALTQVNATLLSNFLSALKISSLNPKRILLQTGAKHYGFHIGPATNPSFESDPRVTLEENFYYAQEDALESYCTAASTSTAKVSWNVVRPSYIIGTTPSNTGSLNHLLGLAIYASVQAHLNQPLYFPGDYVAWDRELCQSSAFLNAYFEEWVVLTDNAANEAFNIQDGLGFTWGRFWPELAGWVGIGWCPPESKEEGQEGEGKYRVTRSRYTETPRGYGPSGKTYSTFSLQEWSSQPSIHRAWAELVAKHNLTLFDSFSRPQTRAQVFGMTDSAVLGGWPLSLSMRKAREKGFFGTVDSIESARLAIKELGRLRVVPPIKDG